MYAGHREKILNEREEIKNISTIGRALLKKLQSLGPLIYVAIIAQTVFGACKKKIYVLVGLFK
jgi:hypothetical protein